MEVEEFFELLVKEVEQTPGLQKYYRFVGKDARARFRKVYYCQRLQYILDHAGSGDQRIWDCGCGYGTTGIFLSLNGVASQGSTLEFYYKEIPARLEYWKKFGDVSKASFSYENMFDTHPPENSKDIILIQDTLHHLEPLQDALAIFKKVLSPEGKLLIVEENGNNIIQNFKLYLRRGNKRIIEIWDEQLKKNILLGNENIRGLSLWKSELKKGGFEVIDSETEYIRVLPPPFFGMGAESSIISWEQKAVKFSLLKEYFYFGLSFIAKPNGK